MENETKIKRENVITNLKSLEGIKNAVSRDSGILEIYYENNLTKIQNKVITFLNKRNLWSCFVSINFIQVEGDNGK